MMEPTAITATAPKASKTSRSIVLTAERGVAMVEYALIVGLIAVVAVVAVGLVGGAVNDSFDGSASAFGSAATTPDYPTETAGVDGKVKATFSLIDGTVALDSVDADGWTMTVVKDTGTRVNTKFKNDTTGEVIRVNGWVNRKGLIKTRVIVR